MKKNFKRAFVILLVLVQLFVLCGCDALDEMRANQAFYNEDGNIVWNGSVYKALPYSDYLSLDSDYSTYVYVTDDDVPVLLSDIFAKQTLSISTDGEFLIGMYYETTYYCEASKYDALSARLQAPFVPDIVCYSYGVYDEETWEYETKYYTLTQEQVDVIRLVTETVEPTVMGDGWSLDCDWSVWLEECSEDMLLRRNTLDIGASGDTYYLFLYTDTETLVFTVPEGCNAAFDEIVSTYLENTDIYWKDDYLDSI